jgi:hypothetical protein
MSGKFASMFLDAVGSVPAEGEWWEVDREAIIAYRDRICEKLEIVKDMFRSL